MVYRGAHREGEHGRMNHSLKVHVFIQQWLLTGCALGSLCGDCYWGLAGLCPSFRCGCHACDNLQCAFAFAEESRGRMCCRSGEPTPIAGSDAMEKGEGDLVSRLGGSLCWVG